MRGSDDNAALYWLARMLEGGETPLYVARRLVRFASEDIGEIGFAFLTLYSIMTPLKYHIFENILENGAFALLEQMLHFPLYFQKISKLKLYFS